MAISGQIKVGLIGAGLIGQTHSLMLRQVAACTESGVAVVAVHDAIPERTRALAAHWPGCIAAPSLDALLATPGLDAVWICTPTRLHREAVLAAARARVHVFCEKPLAMNAAEAREIAQALEGAGVSSQVGLVLRFSPVYNVMREMMAVPEAGRPLAIAMRDDQDFPIRGAHDSPWRNDPTLTAGGTLVEHSVHDLDLLGWMAGPVARIFCRTRNLNGAPGVEDVATTHLEFHCGLHAQLTSVWHHVLKRPSNRRLEILAENLFLACDHDTLGPIIVQRNDGDEYTIGADEVMERFRAILAREHPYLAALGDWLAVPYAVEDAAFVAALHERRAPYPELAAGVAAQALAEAAYESARRGVPVNI